MRSGSSGCRYSRSVSAPDQEVFRARKAWRSQLRLVPHAAEKSSEQRREHDGKVRHLEARPGLLQDSPAILLVANTAYCRFEGRLPKQRPPEPRREAEVKCYPPCPRELVIDRPLSSGCFVGLLFASSGTSAPACVPSSKAKSATQH